MKHTVLHKSAFLLVFIFATVWLVTRSTTQVICTTQSAENCDPEVERSLAALTGKSLIFSDTKAMAESLLQSQPLTVTKVSKDLLGKVEISLAAHTPKYILKTADESMFVVFENGQTKQLFTLPEQLQLFSAFFSSTDRITDGYLQKETHFLLDQLTTALQKTELQPQYITWKEEHSLEIQLEKGPLVFLDPTKLQHSITTIVAILASPELTSLKPVAEIDLRFELPVLRTRE